MSPTLDTNFRRNLGNLSVQTPDLFHHILLLDPTTATADLVPTMMLTLTNPGHTILMVLGPNSLRRDTTFPVNLLTVALLSFQEMLLLCLRIILVSIAGRLGIADIHQPRQKSHTYPLLVWVTFYDNFPPASPHQQLETLDRLPSCQRMILLVL